MPLSPAERAKRYRQRIKQEELISFRLYLDYKTHGRLKKDAARNDRTVHDHIVVILTRSIRASRGRK